MAGHTERGWAIQGRDEVSLLSWNGIIFGRSFVYCELLDVKLWLVRSDLLP